MVIFNTQLFKNAKNKFYIAIIWVPLVFGKDGLTNVTFCTNSYFRMFEQMLF